MTTQLDQFLQDLFEQSLDEESGKLLVEDNACGRSSSSWSSIEYDHNEEEEDDSDSESEESDLLDGSWCRWKGHLRRHPNDDDFGSPPRLPHRIYDGSLPPKLPHRSFDIGDDDGGGDCSCPPRKPSRTCDVPQLLPCLKHHPKGRKEDKNEEVVVKRVHWDERILLTPLPPTPPMKFRKKIKSSSSFPSQKKKRNLLSSSSSSSGSSSRHHQVITAIAA